MSAIATNQPFMEVVLNDSNGHKTAITLNSIPPKALKPIR